MPIANLIEIVDHHFTFLIQEYYPIDAVLTSEVRSPEDESYISLATFRFNANNVRINKLWDFTYDLITYANKALTKIETSNTATVQQDCDVRLRRAYAYWVLTNYFGDVPLITSSQVNYPLERASESDILDFIASENERVINTGTTVQKSRALLLNARVFSKKRKYNQAIVSLTNIINSGNYQLSMVWGGDAIWDAGYVQLLPAIVKGVKSYPMRLAEVYALLAENYLGLGNNTAAMETVNVLNHLHVRSLLTDMSRVAIADDINDLRSMLLNMEGLYYDYLKRSGRFMSELQRFGASEHHSLLPIPQNFIKSNPSVIQNPGY